jgi:hypothetical protein
VSYADLEQQIINYLLKLEDGITLIEVSNEESYTDQQFIKPEYIQFYLCD